MNIIFTAAGKGTRFGGSNKPFVKVKGKTLLEWSIHSLSLEGTYWVVAHESWSREERILFYRNVSYIRNLQTLCTMISFGDSLGQADHALRLIYSEDLDPDSELLIVNCDHYTPWDSKKFKNFLDNSDYDGIVTTYDHGDFTLGQPSKYSHIRLENGIAVELAEKQAISPHSLNGLFYFRKTQDFINAAQELVSSLTIGEAYVSLVYNILIKGGKKIGIYPMESHEFVSLGSPEEIEKNLHKL